MIVTWDKTRHFTVLFFFFCFRWVLTSSHLVNQLLIDPFQVRFLKFVYFFLEILCISLFSSN